MSVGQGPLHFLVPGPLEQRTGGYVYDARIVAELRGRGWTVVVHSIPGRFPDPDRLAFDSFAGALDGLPDDALVLVDGLALEAFARESKQCASRLRVVVLVHHLLSEEMGESNAPTTLRDQEVAALEAVRGVIATSAYTASRIEALGIPSERIRTVEPGTDRPARGPGGTEDVPGTGLPKASPGEGRAGTARPGTQRPGPPTLLCVASIIPRKGHDVLVAALARIADLPWTCRFAGSPDRDPEWAARVRRLVQEHGLRDRIDFLGECDTARLEGLYAAADVLVLPSFFEGYGMVLSEGIVRGLPIVSTTAGAIPFTVPPDAGLLVPPGDAEALADALTRVIGEGGETAREALATGARRRATILPDWTAAGASFEGALTSLAIDGGGPPGETFTNAWLALREPADRSARSEDLARRLRAHWSGSTRPDDAHQVARTVLDLGAGTGSNARWLAPRLAHDQRWILVDRSAAALGEAERRPPDMGPGSGSVSLEARMGDLASEGLSAVDGAELVTASALLDLVSESWLQRLVDRIVARGCPALFALTYDGDITWGDDDPADELIRVAVNQHQGRDKGLGPALGPRATEIAARLLGDAGFDVRIAESPWRLGPDATSLAVGLLDGWRSAALEQRPEAADQVEAWAARRSGQIRGGAFGLRVGHRDILALPPS